MKEIYKLWSRFLHLLFISISKFLPTKGEILMLHWVGDDVYTDDREYYRISTNNCKKLLDWLETKNIIRLEEWESYDDFYALTIDDVPEDFYKNAYPLLKKKGIPFTIFVNVSLLNKDGYISRGQLEEMSQCKLCTVGSHGIKHEMFATFSKVDAYNDLIQSKLILESIVKRPVTLFAFPYGSYFACGYYCKKLATDVYRYGFGTISCPISKPLFFKKYFLPRIYINDKYIEYLQ